jgi:adenosine deaminase
VSSALTGARRKSDEDLAADNVVYAEVRYAPELSTEGGSRVSGRESIERDGRGGGSS